MKIEGALKKDPELGVKIITEVVKLDNMDWNEICKDMEDFSMSASSFKKSISQSVIL